MFGEAWAGWPTRWSAPAATSEPAAAGPAEDVGLSLSAWLAGETLTLLYLDNENANAGTGVDSLYLILYLGLVLALDLQPGSTDVRLRIRPLRLLASAGRMLFVGGLFAYFVLLPRNMGLDEYLTWIPSFSFYVILDLYLVGRLVYSAVHANTPRWRTIYVLLTIAWVFVLATDSIDFAWITKFLADQVPPAAASYRAAGSEPASNARTTRCSGT